MMANSPVESQQAAGTGVRNQCTINKVKLPPLRQALGIDPPASVLPLPSSLAGDASFPYRPEPGPSRFAYTPYALAETRQHWNIDNISYRESGTSSNGRSSPTNHTASVDLDRLHGRWFSNDPSHRTRKSSFEDDSDRDSYEGASDGVRSRRASHGCYGGEAPIRNAIYSRNGLTTSLPDTSMPPFSQRSGFRPAHLSHPTPLHPQLADAQRIDAAAVSDHVSGARNVHTAPLEQLTYDSMKPSHRQPAIILSAPPFRIQPGRSQPTQGNQHGPGSAQFSHAGMVTEPWQSSLSHTMNEARIDYQGYGSDPTRSSPSLSEGEQYLSRIYSQDRAQSGGHRSRDSPRSRPQASLIPGEPAFGIDVDLDAGVQAGMTEEELSDFQAAALNLASIATFQPSSGGGGSSRDVSNSISPPDRRTPISVTSLSSSQPYASTSLPASSCSIQPAGNHLPTPLTTSLVAAVADARFFHSSPTTSTSQHPSFTEPPLPSVLRSSAMPPLSLAATNTASSAESIATSASLEDEHATTMTANGTGKYVCEICSKRFTRPSALAVHSHMHTGERPFTCAVCKRAFSVNSNLRRHMRTHPKIERDAA